MSAKNLSTVGLNCLIISGKQGMHLLIPKTKHHKLEKIRKARDNTLKLVLDRGHTNGGRGVINTQLYSDLG